MYPCHRQETLGAIKFTYWERQNIGGISRNHRLHSPGAGEARTKRGVWGASHLHLAIAGFGLRYPKEPHWSDRRVAAKNQDPSCSSNWRYELSTLLILSIYCS